MRQRNVAGVVLSVAVFWGGAALAGPDAAKPQAAEVQARDTRADQAEASYTERLKEIRLIEIRHLRSDKADEFQKGRQRILAIEDDAAVAPLVAVLYGNNVKYRTLLVEALEAHANRGSKAAAAYLQEIAVGDGDKGRRNHAIKVLKGVSGRPTERLMVHLALDEVPALRDRAATALAAMLEKKAAWLMVERLVTEEVQLVGTNLDRYDVQFDIRATVAGVPTFRQVQLQAAAVAAVATATIELPQVSVIDVATTIAMSERHVLPDYQRVEVKHPEMLAALKQLTGKDFGYNQAAWQEWLRSSDCEIPAWEPLILNAE